MASKESTVKDNTKELEQTFVFPELGKSVQAVDYESALKLVDTQKETK